MPLSLAAQLRRTGILPGLVVALALAAAAHYFSDLIGVDGLGFAKSPVSPVLLAILFGLLVRNVAGLPDWCEDGLGFAVDRVLKFGVALLGFRLSLSAVGRIGLESIPVVVGCIVTALIVVNLLSRRLGLDRRLGTLIGVGTSICGCTAIMTAAPVIRARQSEVCYAVTCVALFGTVAMLVYPFVAQALFADQPRFAGMFLGTAIHDTAQVVGAGMLYQQYFDSNAGFEAATVTKLVRNLSMLIVIPALSLMAARNNNSNDDTAGGQKTELRKLVPLFIAGFVAMSLLRTVGDVGGQAFGFVPQNVWQTGIATIGQFSNLLLAVAMAAVGLSTSFAGIRDIGYRPLIMGFVAAAIVGIVSIGLLSLMR